MTDTKYETLKKAMFDLLVAGQNDDLLKSIKEIADAIDKSEVEKKQEPITEKTYDELTYSERVNLKLNQPDVYKKLLSQKGAK